MLTILVGIIALALLPIALNVLMNLLDALWAFVTKPWVLVCGFLFTVGAYGWVAQQGVA